MQILQNRQIYDVCVIGSGAGGGMAAKVLTEAGANVVMLEAGPMWDPVADSKMFAWPYDTPRRGGAIPERQFGEFDAALGGWTLEGEPYTNAPGDTWDWFRSRMIGGRTNHWGRISLRFGPYDFQRKTLDGLGDDWPITYDDMKPYYDKVDRLIGIFGSMENLPNEPNGIFQPPPKPRCYELLIKEASEKLNIPVIPSRLSILTQPLNGRPACHYCSQCGRGCRTHSNFSSPSVLLPPAMATGRLKIITDAMAREVTVDQGGLADGVIYIDKKTNSDNRVRAKIVVLAASACESARILLNSTSSKFPQGLANSSGVVGKYLTDSTGLGVTGFIPKLMDGIPHNEDGTGGMHLFMPWWGDNKKLDFPRGYHIEIGGGRRMPTAGFGGGIHQFTGIDAAGRPIGVWRVRQAAEAGLSPALWRDGQLRRPRRNDPEQGQLPRHRSVGGRQVGHPGAALPFQVERLRDQPGEAHAGDLPRDHRPDGGHADRRDAVARAQGFGIAAGGRIIHELGVTRMGNDPSTSVLNSHCQAHDVKNLFVADGGPFVTQPDKNCTWTILALSMRTSEYIAQQRNAGTV